MAIHDVALGDEVAAPDGIQDLVSGGDASAATGEEIQEALLDTAKVDHGVTGPHPAMEDVDLHFAELDRGNDRHIRSRRPTGDNDRTSEQLLGREWHRQDVVDPEIERLELRLQVAPSSETQDRRPTP